MPIFLPDADPLFSQRHLGTLLNNQIGGMENRVNELADELFLSIPAPDLIDEISLGAYLQPLVLQAEHGVSHPPLAIESGKGVVPGATFRYFVEIPYTGASGLFNHEPSTNDLDRPTASLNSHSMQGSIIIKRVATTDVPDDELRASFDAELAKVRKYINYQALEIEPYNASLKAEAERIVNGRRERLLCEVSESPVVEASSFEAAPDPGFPQQFSHADRFGVILHILTISVRNDPAHVRLIVSLEAIALARHPRSALAAELVVRPG